MANPKYIDESLLPKEEEEVAIKKGSKKAYSFRCDETLLEDMTTYAKLDGISLPQLLSNLMADFLNDKVLSNDYLRGYAGIYININSNVNEDIFEYELRFIMNNLDVWNSTYGYVSKYHESEHNMYDGTLHEGIDFLVIPETVHTGKLPDDAIMGMRQHHVNLDYIPSCLYCIYVTVDNNHGLNYEVISWIDAMNKLKAVGRYDLIAHGNKIKRRLNNLHQKWITEGQYIDDIVFIDDIYVNLLRIADEYNTGAILPADKSIDNIEYLPVIEKLPDAYEIISDLVKENKRLKKMEDKFNDIRAKIEEIENMNREEVWQEFIKGSDDNQDEISDDPKNE